MKWRNLSGPLLGDARETRVGLLLRHRFWVAMSKMGHPTRKYRLWHQPMRRLSDAP